MNLERAGYWLCGTTSLFLSLSACDSTGGIDASGDPVAGIDGSGGPEAVSAPVDGFGSIIINDEIYNTDSAEFFIRGVNGGIERQSDLEEGQLTTLITDEKADTPSASKVFYFPNVTGPVTFVDPISERIMILGRSVIITPQTKFDDTFPGEKSFTGVQVGMSLTVSGTERSDGTIVATYLNQTSTNTVDISGFVADLDMDSKTFAIGSQLVSFSALPDFSAANGDAIWLEGVLREDGALVADQVFGRDDREASLAAETIELEGRISDWHQAARTFMLGVLQVSYGEDILTSGLTLGSQVLVKGQIEGGAVKATSLELVTPSLIHRTGTIENIGPLVDTPEPSSDFLTFTDLLGQYKVDNTTPIQDRQGNPLSVADLQPGDIVSFTLRTFPTPTCTLPENDNPNIEIGFSLGLELFIALGVGGGLGLESIVLEFRASENIVGIRSPTARVNGVSAEGLVNLFGQPSVNLTEDARLENLTARALDLSELSDETAYSVRIFGTPDADNPEEFESISFMRFLASSLDCEN